MWHQHSLPFWHAVNSLHGMLWAARLRRGLLWMLARQSWALCQVNASFFLGASHSGLLTQVLASTACPPGSMCAAPCCRATKSSEQMQAASTWMQRCQSLGICALSHPHLLLSPLAGQTRLSGCSCTADRLALSWGEDEQQAKETDAEPGTAAMAAQPAAVILHRRFLGPLQAQVQRSSHYTAARVCCQR